MDVVKLKRNHRTLEETVQAAARIAQMGQKELCVVKNRLDGEHCFFGANLWPTALEPDLEDWQLVAEVHSDGTTTFVEEQG